MTDTETISVYTKAAGDYARGFANSKNPDQDPDYAAFVAGIPAGGRILDLGCGPGHWAARFREDGFVAEATDATQAMADLALERFGITVWVETFEALKPGPIYDGIWANFSLLHATRADLPAHLTQLHSALKPGGALHLGMKLGESEGRDKLGRFYAYYDEPELLEMLTTAGFTVTRTRRGNGKGLAGGNETFLIVTAHG